MKFMINGQLLDANTIVALAPKRKAKQKDGAPQVFHKGYRVVGHAPGSLEKAHNLNVEEWRRWNSHDANQRARAIKDGRRPPPMWDEEQWRLRTKKTAVRTKPYEIAAAADECAELARKQGWLDVQVLALSQGDAPPPGMF